MKIKCYTSKSAISRFSIWILTAFLFLQVAAVKAELIAYDPFVNANVANGLNNKTAGEYNAGSFFRDFTNGNNNTVAGGPIVGWSAANLWQGNSAATSTYIGPTSLAGLTSGLNAVQGGNAQARALNTAGGVAYARRMLDAYTPSNTYYMSGLIRCDKFSTNLNIKAMMGFTNTISAGTFDGTVDFPGAIFGFNGDGSKVDLVVRHRDDNALIKNSTLLSNAQSGTVYFVVVKIEYDAVGNLETLTAWLDPTASQESGAAAAFTTTGQILTSADQMTYGGFYIENFTSGINDYVQFDEIRLGTEWADVVPVPDTREIITLAQNFSVPDNNFMLIDRFDVPENPQRPGFDITPTGWRWGGYTNGTTADHTVEIDQNARGGVTFDELIFKNRSPKAYAYTIFSSAGTNQPDSSVDMTPSWASMDFKISAIYHGNFVHSTFDNGSGLPYPGNQYYAPVLRALIRDANGKWFGSSLFLASSYQGTHGDLFGTIIDCSLPFAGMQWYEYSQNEIDSLNALTGGGEIPLNHDPNLAETTPDLTSVTGMGIYVWNSPTWSAGNVAFTEISLTGTTIPTPPDYWDDDDLQAMINDWLKSEIIWEETMDPDPLTGGNWVMRGAIPGDYLIAGGQMLILGNSYGAWRLDTYPETDLAGQVTVNARMQATTGSDTSVGSRSGINFWISLDTAQNHYGSINYNVVLDGANQYVEFISGWTAGVTWPPSGYTRITGSETTSFNNTMLDITLLIKPSDPNEGVPTTTFDINYTIADESGTTASGTLVMNRRDDANPIGAATILTGGAQGVVDYIYINGEYVALSDKTGDGFVDYEDFAWLADRWLTLKEDPLP